MASIGYDPAYAAIKRDDIEAQIKALRAQIKDLTAQKKKYQAPDEEPTDQAPDEPTD